MRTLLILLAYGLLCAGGGAALEAWWMGQRIDGVKADWAEDRKALVKGQQALFSERDAARAQVVALQAEATAKTPRPRKAK